MTEHSSLLSFPCKFPIKVMGYATEAFEQAVLTIISNHVPDLAENALRTRSSKDGKYLSITITITAQSQTQLDNIYLELTASTEVLMAL